MLKKVYAVDVLSCPRCEGRMKLVAITTGQKVVKEILEHLDLPSTGPPVAPAREPLQMDLMSERDWKRLDVIKRVEKSELTVSEGA